MKQILHDHYIRVVGTIALAVLLYILYYSLVVIPQRQIDEQRRAATERDIKATLEEAEKKSDYEACISESERSYSGSWLRACNSRGLLDRTCKELFIDTPSDKQLALYRTWHPEYTATKDMDSSESIDLLIESLDAFYKAQDDCSCMLPTHEAESIGDRLDSDKERCEIKLK